MNQPIDWKQKIRQAAQLATAKGLKLERLTFGGGNGWWITFPAEQQRKKLRISGAAKLIEFVESYQSN